MPARRRAVSVPSAPSLRSIEPVRVPRHRGPGGRLRTVPWDNESEVERLVCDNRRVRELTSWCPAYDLEAGLRETIDWVRGHQDAFKAGVYTV